MDTITADYSDSRTNDLDVNSLENISTHFGVKRPQRH